MSLKAFNLAVYSPLSLPLSRSALFFLDSACSIRQHTSAYVLHPACIMSTHAFVHAFTYTSPAVYVSRRQHTSAYVLCCSCIYVHLVAGHVSSYLHTDCDGWRLPRATLAICVRIPLYYYMCVRILLHVSSHLHTACDGWRFPRASPATSAYGLLQLCVRILLYMCPHICIQITMSGITTSGKYEDTSSNKN
jgi:hypothetical protein